MNVDAKQSKSIRFDLENFKLFFILFATISVFTNTRIYNKGFLETL
jgi:hypothetical protein